MDDNLSPSARMVTRWIVSRPPAAPAFVCIHQLDWEAYTDVTTPPALVDAIAAEYRMSGSQKVYIGVCLCWSDAEHCRVCSDTPFVEFCPT